MKQSSLVLAALFGTISAQQVGHQKQEMHQPLGLKHCTKANGCQYQDKKVTMDSNWRWTHKTGTYTNCYTGAEWDKQTCPDPQTCAQNCAIDGVPSDDWKNTYGIHSDGLHLQLGFVTKGQYATNVGSRTYMMADDDNYEMFQLLGNEFTITVDVSNMPCGVNGALYFVEMDKTGNKGGGNMAGAKYGTGYCDAQCPHDIKFIDGGANVIDWKASATDPNAGVGKWGSCCAEMDIWEANKISSAYTAHPCNFEGQKKCEDPKTCGDNASNDRYNGVCDKDGCDLNPFRAGAKDFYGEGKTVDTSKPFSVVTQFLTDANGDLGEIRRKFVQGGKVIEHPMSKVDTMDKQFDSITDEMCTKQKTAFGDHPDFQAKGGLKQMGKSLKNGMVLVMSLWDDHDANMLWLDSTYPVDQTSWGGPRGTCATTSGVPKDVEQKYPNSAVKYGDIRVGEIDSTYKDLTYEEPTFMQ